MNRSPEVIFNKWCEVVVHYLGNGWSVTPNSAESSAVFSNQTRQVRAYMTPDGRFIRWEPVGGGLAVSLDVAVSPQELASSILGN